MENINNPTLDVIDKYMDSIMDKAGSDYASLPDKLDRFIANTYSMIESSEIYLDATQAFSDDIRPLIKERSDISISKNTETNKWEVPIPTDYLRLVTLYPLIDNRRLAREVKILRNGQEDYELNPFRSPNFEYPNVFRIGDFLCVDTGRDDNRNYQKSYIKYVKHPTFADVDDLDARIVNLSTELIIRICHITADSFRYTSGDNFAPYVESFHAKFGKRNRT